MDKSPATHEKIEIMPTTKLQRLAAWWEACSLAELDNERSTYHTWAIRARLELIRRQQQEDKCNQSI